MEPNLLLTMLFDGLAPHNRIMFLQELIEKLRPNEYELVLSKMVAKVTPTKQERKKKLHKINKPPLSDTFNELPEENMSTASRLISRNNSHVKIPTVIPTVLEFAQEPSHCLQPDLGPTTPVETKSYKEDTGNPVANQSHSVTHLPPISPRISVIEQANNSENVHDRHKHLKIHEQRHVGDKVPLNCAKCPKTFPTVKKLHRHEKTHIAEKPFPCDQCQRSYAQQGELNRHKKMSHGENKFFMCNKCSKTFRREEPYEEHIKTCAAEAGHKIKQIYSCEICGKCFKSDRYMKKHKLTHPTVKPYGCSYCGKHFENELRKDTHEKRCRESDDKFKQDCHVKYNTQDNIESAEEDYEHNSNPGYNSVSTNNDYVPHMPDQNCDVWGNEWQIQNTGVWGNNSTGVAHNTHDITGLMQVNDNLHVNWNDWYGVEGQYLYDQNGQIYPYFQHTLVKDQ